MADPAPFAPRLPGPSGLAVEELRVTGDVREYPITAVKRSDTPGRIWIEVDLGDTTAPHAPNAHPAVPAADGIDTPSAADQGGDALGRAVDPTS